MTPIWISAGSNIEPQRNLRRGIALLRERLGELKLSPVFETEAFGFEGPAFLNMVVGASTGLEVSAVVAMLRDVENRCGRRRDVPRFSSRTLDLDLLCHGDKVGEIDGCKFPHPDALSRDFTLAPLAALAGSERVPGSERSWDELWAGMRRQGRGPCRVEFNWDEE